MDVTNPGLVNVANQVVGNPSLAPASSLAVPKQDDALEDVAGDGHPRAEDVSLALDAATTVGPTPLVVQAGDESPAVSAQVTAQVPGTAPFFAPTPQFNIVDTVAQQQIPGVNTTEIVVGPNSNIQTNQNAETEKHYVVTSIVDADTGGLVVDPTIPITGTFSAVFDGGSGTLFIVSPSAFPAQIIDGIVVSVVSTAGASYNINAIITGVTSLSGTVIAASDAGGGKVTFSSPTSLPAGLVNGQPVTLATTVGGYNGARLASGVTNTAGTFAAVLTNSGGTKIEVVSTALIPAALVAGKFATLTGGVYTGTHKVSGLGTAQNGNFDTAADNGGGGTTFHATAPLPAQLVIGQSVTVAGAVYNGTYVVTNVNSGAQTFDLAVAFSATDAGTWAQVGNYSFIADVAYSATDTGTWTCYTFDVTVTYTSTATGTWNSYTFKIPGTYSATASGTWSYTPVAYFTTRYRLGMVAQLVPVLIPANLTSFGVSLAGRELVFDDNTLTVADRGANRLIESYNATSLVISRSDLEDDTVPVMTPPQVGDGFTLYVQREGAEVFTDDVGTPTNVIIAPSPPTFMQNPAQALQSQGTVDVTVGPQPGQVLITSGVVVPTAANVNVANQATTVGLPTNVFV